MRIIDANLIIYFAQPGFAWLNHHIQTDDTHFSTLTKVEVLGFSKIKPHEKLFFEVYFDSINPLPLTDAIIEKAIELRQAKKMSLGDSIIAATALVHGLVVYTHNTADFAGIVGLQLIDPIATPQ
ncbi:MAG: type II toxin-antitoxin system VapC family toxin [Saprospiraceae bacterium]